MGLGADPVPVEEAGFGLGEGDVASVCACREGGVPELDGDLPVGGGVDEVLGAGADGVRAGGVGEGEAGEDDDRGQGGESEEDGGGDEG